MSQPRPTARVVLDAMGGDHAPSATVDGALQAAEDGFPILLVGEEAVLDDALKERGGLPDNVQVLHASQFVEMEDAPRDALRGKRDSSLRIALRLVRNGQGDAVVTMGHSGAALGLGIVECKRIPGVSRPGIAALIPGAAGPVVLLDAGANVDCRAEHLVQFGLMGAALATAAFGVQRPSVGVLANGEEANKGTAETRAACDQLSRAPHIDFRGHVEPDGLLAGTIQVAVCDGWTGNIALKTAEGTLRHVVTLLREAARKDARSQLGGWLLRPALRRALEPLDPANVGGGLLVGVEACAVIGHGSADARAVASALRLAHRLAEQDLLGRLRASLAADLSASVEKQG